MKVTIKDNKSTYEKLDYNPFPNVVHELKCKLSLAHEASLHTKKECKQLTVREYNIPIIYVIPKIHKSSQDTPIISAIKGPLEKQDHIWMNY